MWIKAPVPEYVNNPNRMLQICREIEDTKICGLDTETTGLDLAKDHVLFWSLSPSLDSRYCLSREMLYILDKELRNNSDITWVMTNANFDNCMLANSGVPLLAGDIHCTLVMDWLHDENRTGRHGLKTAAKDHLGLQMNEFKKVFPKKQGETFQDTLLRVMEQEPDKAVDYASMDAWASLALHGFLKKKLEAEHTYNGLSLWDLFHKFEAPYGKVLYDNIRNGVMVDAGYLEQLKGPMESELDRIAKAVNKSAGKVLNPNSPAQLVELFIDTLGKKPLKWTTGGKSGNKKPSVDVNVLTRWAEEGDDLAAMLLEHRGLAKMKGTYIDGILKRLSSGSRIHSTLKQHGTVTGRLSSTDPNMQNLPNPGEDKWCLRGAFMPATGYVLAACDYAQLEMRIMAHLSGDENMRNVIREGKDIHMGTAALMYDIPYEKIKEAKRLSKHVDEIGGTLPDWAVECLLSRRNAKGIGFGINYGEGVHALARKLKVTADEAHALREKYFKPYPNVRKYIEDTHNKCRATQEVNTILGHKRRLLDADADWKPGFFSKRDGVWVDERPGPLAARALRQAVNSEIQGAAANIAKCAQRLCFEDQRLRDLGVRQLLQVHDEVLFEIPEENGKEAGLVIKEIMQKPFAKIPEWLGLDFDELSVPLDVDLGFGEAWSEAH